VAAKVAGGDANGDVATRKSQAVDLADEISQALGKLQALAGVSEYPVRVKCASLAWHTLKAAIAGAAEPVSTE